MGSPAVLSEMMFFDVHSCPTARRLFLILHVCIETSFLLFEASENPDLMPVTTNCFGIEYFVQKFVPFSAALLAQNERHTENPHYCVIEMCQAK